MAGRAWRMGVTALVFLGLSCAQILGIDSDYHAVSVGGGGGGASSTSSDLGTASGGSGGSGSTSGASTTTAMATGTTITTGDDGCWVAPETPCPVQALAAGAYFTCALLAGGSVKCWGDNNRGQLGLGDTQVRGDEPGEMGDNLPPVNLGSGQKATAIAAGALHACALLEGGSVKCWGYGEYGQLGLGDKNDRGDEPGEMGDNLPPVDLGSGQKAIGIAAGGGHTCALLEGGSVKCWGYGTYGQLGLGSQADRGDEPGEMGDSLPAVDLGPGPEAIAVVMKGTHTCALLKNGTLKCWGANAYGQLGLGDVQNRGDEPGEMGDSLPALQVDSAKPAMSLAVCPYQTCALLLGGGIKCWGQNHMGQLGHGNDTTWGDDPDEMVFDLSFVSLGAAEIAVAVAAGYSGFGASGGAHTCALLASGGLKCWGANYAGQLGLGDTLNRGDDPGEMGDNLEALDLGTSDKITAIAAGSDHTCAVLAGAQVKCWGLNEVGELGLGDTESRGDEPGEMGDNLPVVDVP